MGTTRLLMRSVPALGLLAVLLSYGGVSNRVGAATGLSYSDANTPRASAMPATGEPVLKRASHVMHARIKSPDGKTLGRVHDLVLTPDLNGISYVALSSGGILGIGSTLHAIPWSSLTESVNNTYVAPISEQQFKQSRGFRPAYWPSSAENAGVALSTDTGHGPATETSADVQNRRFTRIRGSTVKASDGKNAGKVHDLMLVMDSGRIAYTIVSYGGLAGLGARFAAVPQNAVTLEPAQQVARVNATPATLHANSFTPHQWPDLASPTFVRQLDRTFGVPPSETALGYVPAEGPVAKATPKTPARSTTPPVSGTTPSMTLAEPTPTDLTGTFNPSSITALDGTVTDVGKFKATATGPDMLWLRIRTEDGRTVLVNLGPRSYISAQDFYVVRGDRIHLSGSEVAATTSGKRVFLPTETTYDNHALRLRNTTGTPLWEGQTTTPGTAGIRGTTRRAAGEPNEPNKP